MSAEILDPAEPIEWLQNPRDCASPPQPGLLDWLTYGGLLTVRLKRACANGFRLELLEARDGPGLLVTEARIRRVILWCGDQPCVYAESHLPQQAMDRVPSLQRLGGDPLGEALQSHPDITRGAFEYALLHAPALPPSLGAKSRQPLWARRSTFNVGDSRLTVAEVFLPAIEALQA